MNDQISETGGCRASPIILFVRKQRNCRFKRPWAVCWIIFSVLAILMFAGYAFSQTLDNAVSRQLDYGPELRACWELLDEGTVAPGAVLIGPLREICDRSPPSPAAGPSESGGGGAAIPNTLPTIFQQRMREARGDEKEPAIFGASADAVAEYAGGVGLFFSVSSGDLERDLTKFEDGYDSDIWRITAGIDYQFNNRFTAGFALDYYQHDGQYDSGGGFENDYFGLLVFGSVLPMDNLFLQAYGGLALAEYDRNRFAVFVDTDFEFGPKEIFPIAGGAVRGSYDGLGFRAGALTGYHIAIKRFTVSPRLGFDWLRREFDDYSENGDTGLELQFDDDDQKFFQSRVGLAASMAFKTRFGAIVPQAAFDWRHEFENDQRNIDVSFVGDTRAKQFSFETEPPDRDWYEINAGIVAVLPHDLQAYGNFRMLSGHSFYDGQAVTLGLRADF
jgi:outer membrane autotransporter protein